MVASSQKYVEDCLGRKIIFFTGKGGVGKTTVAWATAAACQRRGARVAVASWSPFEEDAVPRWAESLGVRYHALETLAAFKEYVLLIFKFEKVYDTVFDNKVLRTFVRAAPGLAETVVGGKLWNMVDKNEQDLLIVDLPASGHATSFFQSPLGIRKMFPVGFVNKEAGKIEDLFRQASTRVDLVALPEELPLVECLELKQKLETILPFHFGYLHLNEVTPAFPVPESGLPAPLERLKDHYAATREREEEAMALAFDLHLPVKKIPRFLPTPGCGDESQAVVRKTADYLEQA